MNNIFKIIVMQSHEDADKIINELKYQIKNNQNRQEITLEYDDSFLLDSDKRRIQNEIKKYISQVM